MRNLFGTILLSLVLCTASTAYAQNADDPWAAWKDKDYATALNGFKTIAEKGDAKAQERLGWMHKNGEGTPKDNVQAAAWFRRAASQGNAPSQAELGWILMEGRGVEKDDTQAIDWFRKAADQGNASAQFGLGLSYVSGRGVAKDERQAITWYEKSAQQGHVRAKVNLDELIVKSKNAVKDEAALLLRQTLAALQQSAKVQVFPSKVSATEEDAQWRRLIEAAVYGKNDADALAAELRTFLEKYANKLDAIRACYELPPEASTAAALGSMRMAKTTKCKLAST